MALRSPLRLTPLLVDKPWGGRQLAAFGKHLPPGRRVGESWEVADLAAAGSAGVTAPATPVAAGPFAGQTLAELIALDREALLGAAAPCDGRFPLLIKLLDVTGALSVQVHPPPALVAGHADAAPKTESWVALAADPGAELLLGLIDGVGPDEVRAAAGRPALLELLRRVPARPGTVHHLPAGTVHGARGGVVLAEVQTPSDTTYRLYDWTDGSAREGRVLHVAAAVRAIEAAWRDGDASRSAAEAVTLPLETAHYRLDRHHLDADEVVALRGGRLLVLQVLEGTLVVEGLDGEEGEVATGGTVLLPAAWSGSLQAIEAATWLETSLP